MTHYARERIANPVYFFETPDEVLEDDKLSQDQKEKVLKSMAVDAEQMVDATAEGMESPEQSYKSEDLRRALAKLREITHAANTMVQPQQTPVGRFKQIVVVTTVSQDLNRVVLDHALDLSEMSGGEVSLLNVVPQEIDAVGPAIAVPMAGTAQVVSVDQSEILEDRKKLLTELRDISGADETVAIEVRSGPIEDEIVDYAETFGADVIVVGSPNRSWLEGLFEPAMHRQVTKFAPCPVLVVPEQT
ncbi:MAG: universal stress protein [Sulfitobacter sp.]